MAGSRLTPKVKAYFEVLATSAKLNGAAAAAHVGYKHPGQTAGRLKQKWPHLYQQAEDRWKNRLLMDAKEVDERLAAVARDPKHKDHFNALKTLAQMHGKLDNKLVMQFDRAALNQQLDEMLSSMAQAKATANSAKAPEAAPTVPSASTLSPKVTTH